MDRIFYVYMLSNKWRGTIYTGMSGNLPKRGFDHKEKTGGEFSKKYNLDRLVWYEVHPDASSAAYRERQIKKWKREWKVELIEKENPEWRDLYPEVVS